jgi:TRAP transporter TAXI family solute receptor
MPHPPRPKVSFVRSREWFVTLVPATILILIGLLFVMRFVEPGPPKRVVMATGSTAGAYYEFGQRFAQVLARSGVKLEVRPSKGSLDNLRLLEDEHSGVSIGLLQGGISNATQSPGLVSIGRMFHEPLWIFYRGSTTIDRLSQLKGKRIAVGPEGSGTRALAVKLLEANDVNEQTAKLSDLTTQDAVDAMAANQLDAIFLTISPQASLIQSLLRRADFRLVSLTQAEAYTKKFPFLAHLTLPQGVFDLVANVPSHDINLIGPRAALVVRSDLHPAIVALLAEAAQEIHGRSGLLNKANEFPTLTDPEFEMNPDALRYYKSGPTFWKRILPFWLANLAERLVILLLPVLTVVIPLSKAVPFLYRFRYRQRLHYWYKRLREVEIDLSSLTKGDDASALHAELDQIDEAVSNVPVPLQFAEQFYDLRSNIDLVRQRLQTRIA